MPLSAPIFILKRQAQRLARVNNIPLHQALDQIARREGFAQWSLLAHKGASGETAASIYRQLKAGSMLLIGARPLHGKTLFALELLIEAIRSGQQAAFFSLEYTPKHVERRMERLAALPELKSGRLLLNCSDEISADYIIACLDAAPAVRIAAIDYLQALDQRRENPHLQHQMQQLHDYAVRRGLILCFIAQISRLYDDEGPDWPVISDVKLPNPLDMSLFGSACFLRHQNVQFQRL